jgi:hypothetical protein
MGWRFKVALSSFVEWVQVQNGRVHSLDFELRTLSFELYSTTGQRRPFLLMICRDTPYSSRKTSVFSTARVAPE